MSLVYIGNSPSRFQYGDLVRATVIATGAEVEGVILAAADNKKDRLSQGDVEVLLDNGERLWVKAFKVVKTKGQREHPLVKVEEVTRFQWTCWCGNKGVATTKREAEQDHQYHSDIA